VQSAANIDPWLETAVDWEATLAYRRHLWGLAAVAEAMDTAQPARVWIGRRRRADRRRWPRRGRWDTERIACGAGTDQLAPSAGVTLQHVIAAYEEQCLSSKTRAGASSDGQSSLASCARRPEVLHPRLRSRPIQCGGPVILHWLGDISTRALTGYWGSTDLDAATDVCLGLIHACGQGGRHQSIAARRQREVALRRRLPARRADVHPAMTSTLPRLGSSRRARIQRRLLGISMLLPRPRRPPSGPGRGDRVRYEADPVADVAFSRHVSRRADPLLQTGLSFLA